MKIKVISPFQDIITKEKRNIEDEFEVTEERGLNLIERNLAVKVEDEIIEDEPLTGNEENQEEEDPIDDKKDDEVTNEENNETSDENQEEEEVTDEKPKKAKKGE